MATLEKVKILVVGDSGVGKTSLVHLICHGESANNPSWTIGCSLNVKLHEYKEGTPSQKTYFIELWDVGGSSSHASSRNVFYTSAHGVILVHDMTNRKSEQNLRKWLAEILNKEANGKGKCTGVSNSSSFQYDAEQFVDSQLPITVVGTKQDLAQEVRSSFSTSSRHTSVRSQLAEECGADEIILNSCQAKSLAPGSSNAVKLSRFFDKVIEQRYFSRETGQSYLDKRRYFASSASHTSYSKAYHND